MRWAFAIFIVLTGIYLVRVQSTRNTAIRRILFTLFIILGLSSLIFADYWTQISNFFGVESGTSLLTYIVTYTFVFYVISNFKWKREMEIKLANLTRHIALIQFEDKDEN